MGERGVVGVVGVVASLGVSSDVWDSGGGDGLWRSCLIINLGISSSASRSSTPAWLNVNCRIAMRNGSSTDLQRGVSGGGVAKI